MAGRAESPASPRRIQAAEKRRRALQMRKGGATYEQIAAQVGYASKATAYKAVRDELRALPADDAGELRTLERSRLDALLTAAWSKAMRGDLWAVDRCLRIMERRAALEGLDAPQVQRVEVITRDVIEAEIERLSRELGYASVDEADAATADD